MNEEEDLEEHPRRRIRRYKKEAVMSQECHDYVMAGKRLPKLHSAWIYNRYINDHNALVGGIPLHNRTVTDLQQATMKLIKVNRKLDQIQEVVAYLKLHYPVLVWDEQFQEMERLADKDSSPRYDQP